MLGRTGEQLYNSDKETLVARMARKGQPFPSPTLTLRAHSRSSRSFSEQVTFSTRLSSFSRRLMSVSAVFSLFAGEKRSLILSFSSSTDANTIRDRTVPYVTGAFADNDPFADFEMNGLEV